jgi:hypothetical protein
MAEEEKLAENVPIGQWRPKNKSQLAKWQKLMGSAETLRAQTIDFAECIPPPSYVPQRGMVRRSHVTGDDEDLDPIIIPPQPSQTKLLDGFMLLEACHVELPDEARRADVNGKDIGDVAKEDLQYFTNLAYLDIGDNRAPFDPLGEFPALRELHCQCNLLQQITPLTGFKMLEILNLSYNALLPSSVAELAAMPKLRELDLTCNGLQELPEMLNFHALEVLILERNRFGNEAVSILAKIPKLKVLNTGFNYISAMPAHLETEPGFRCLEELNLSNNYIAAEEDIFPLVYLQRLQLVILYGNPLTEEVETRDLLANGTGENKITTITAVPDDTKHRPGQGTYTNFRVKHIDEPERPKYGMALDQLERGAVPSIEMGPAVGSPQKAQQSAEVQEEEEDEAHEKDGTFITGMDMEEMLRQDPDDGLEDEEDEEDDGLAVPEMVLTRSLAAANPPNPAKLRSAINALRYALKHPLTSHNSYPKKNQRQVDRPTFAHLCRQRPRKPLETKEQKQQKLEASAKGENLDTIENVLDQMNDRLTAAELDVDSAMNSDQNMASLVNMVGKVMETYEGY